MFSDSQRLIGELDLQLSEEVGDRKPVGVRAQLEAGMSRCRARLDAGASLDEARQLRALLSAYVAALTLLPHLDQSLHSQPRRF
ncbi:MAG TPA: hypothetical protein VFO41_15120 [Alphaproteobacteria bacterium]|nr:hypothetical protein [Alphaproteobacteria bacterium]